MLSYTYFGKGDFRLCEKPVPELKCDTDALVRVTLSSICTSDLHILHGYVPRAVPGITVGHEAVGEVVAVGAKIRNVKPGDRVSVNVETFCGAFGRLGARMQDRRHAGGIRTHSFSGYGAHRDTR